MSNLINNAFSSIKNLLLDAIIKPTIIFVNDNASRKPVSSEDIAPLHSPIL